jgi:hypothetical protein
VSDERRQHLEAVEAVVKAFHYEPYDMAEEIVRLRAAIERVRALSMRTGRSGDGIATENWEILRALDGEAA